MAELVLAAMLASATLYAVLAGADFGAGMTEGLIGPDARTRVDVALAPVWEANHVWLVLLAVLAFVGFPPLYALVSSYLHLPLLGALLGIVARGTAFTFRHYDPRAGALRRGYTQVFRIASALTPLFLGITLAAIAGADLGAEPSAGFYAVYVAPWNTAFGWATGAFACALFAFEGVALLAAENARPGAPLPYLGLTRRMHALAIASGALVLLAAFRAHLPWLQRLLGSAVAGGALLAATLLIGVSAYAFRRGRPWLLRLAIGAQTFCVLLGFAAGQFPVLLRVQGADILYRAAAAPPPTLRTLLWALLFGLVVILPGTAYLIAVYKTAPRAGRRQEP